MEIVNTESDSGYVTAWNRWFREAKGGNPDAAHRFFLATDPYIRKFYREPIFRNRLGKDEIYSIASFALAKLMTDITELPPDNEVPFLIRRVIRCELLDCIRKMDVRIRHEQSGGSETPEGTAAGRGGPYDSGTGMETADNRAEPEARFLKQDLCREVRKAMTRLPEKQRLVIDGLFFQHKKMSQIAREMHCSPQNVRVIRINAMTRLHRLLKPVTDV